MYIVVGCQKAADGQIKKFHFRKKIFSLNHRLRSNIRHIVEPALETEQKQISLFLYACVFASLSGQILTVILKLRCACMKIDFVILYFY